MVFIYLPAYDDEDDGGRQSLPRRHDDGATAAWRPVNTIVLLRRPATQQH